MNTAEHIPDGYRVDHLDPDRFVVRCPSCERTTTRQTRMGKDARKCIHCGRLRGVTPVSEIPSNAPGEGQRALTDGGFQRDPDDWNDDESDEDDRVDPENLPGRATPAYIQVRGQGPVYVADYKILDSGWIRVREWRERVVKLPPHRVQAIRNVRTEFYGERDDRGNRSKRVADEEQREQARTTDAAVPGNPDRR